MITIKKIDPRRLLGVRIALDSGHRRLGTKLGTKMVAASPSLRLGAKLGEKTGVKG